MTLATKGTWSFYDLVTGEIHGLVFSGPARALDANTPSGTKAIEGRCDSATQRVDLLTGKVTER